MSYLPDTKGKNTELQEEHEKAEENPAVFDLPGSHQKLYVFSLKMNELVSFHSKLNHPGVYLLVRDDELYAGQVQARKSGLSAIERFEEHNRRSGRHWKKAYFFSTKIPLDNDELCYLEHMLYKTIAESRYQVANKRVPIFHLQENWEELDAMLEKGIGFLKQEGIDLDLPLNLFRF